MIPKLLHRIWLDEPPPERFEGFWRRFAELHPTWSLVTWDDSAGLPPLVCEREFQRCQTHAGRADILRYELLYQFGGVYVDADVEPLRAFDPLLEDGRPFVAWEDTRLICPTVLGSPPGHRAFWELLRRLPMTVRRSPKAPPNVQTGPHFITPLWRRRRDVTLLPPVTFYPVHWSERGREQLGEPYPPESYAVHHWAKGWEG